MSTKPFDYSKWDAIELSDDEDSHPGAQFIEAQTLRRIKREAHEHKERERVARVDALKTKKKALKREIKSEEETLVRTVETLTPEADGNGETGTRRDAPRRRRERRSKRNGRNSPTLSVK
jgi:cell division cycle protein 37